MKKIILITFFLIMFAVLVNAKTAPHVEASILRYDPAPAIQGGPLKVWIKLQNFGTSTGDAQIKFEPKFPFSLPEEEEKIKDIGVIPGTEEAIVDFDVLVDLNALNKEYDITFYYKWSESNVWVELKEPILIETTDSLVVISNYEVIPKIVNPGSEVEIKLTIKNEGMSGIKTADVSLDSSGMDFFSTLETGSTKRISGLRSGESKEIIFKLMTDANAEIKVYNTPLTLRYVDDKNREFTKISKIGIKMNALPDLIMFVDNSDIFKRKTPGKVRVKIVNKGITDVKYVTLKLIKTPDYDVLSPSNIAYIGNLDNDDFDSAEFTIKPLEKEPKLQFLLEFKDIYNTKYAQEYSLPLRIVSKRELGLESSKFPLILVLLIIAGIGYWYYKKRKKKK